MPSGPKRRRAAKRKQENAQAKQADELATVSVVKLSIPIEELAKGAVWHEAASVDKELDKDKNTIGQVFDELKVASIVVEENEVPLLDVTSNEDNVVLNDEPLVSQTAGCIIESGESDENIKGNESCGVVCSDTKEVFEQVHDHDLLSDSMMPDEFLERYHDLFSDNDTTTLAYDNNREFFFGDVPVVGPGEAAEVGVLAANEAATVGKEFEEVSCEFKDLSVVENAVEENVESLLEVSTNVDKVMSNDETVMPQTAGYIVESSSKDYELLSVGAPVEKIEAAPLVSVTVVSNESIKDAENIAKFNELLSVVLPEEMKDTNPVAAGVSNISKEIESTSMFYDQSSETPEGTKDTAQLVSKKDTLFFLPRLGFPVALASPTSNSNEHVNESALSAENTCNSSAEIQSVSKEMQALPAGTVSPATESEVSEIPSDSKEIQTLPTGKVSPATEDQVSEIPSGSKKMQALPTGEVSPAMEDQVSEIPSDSKEMQAVPTTVSPATENQFYFACPMHCNPECCFAKWPRCQSDVENMMSSVVDLKSAIHSLKEDLQKALDKLDAISY